MTFYFGKPSASLVALPDPLRGITPTNERASTMHVSSSGGRQVDLAPRTRRTFTLHWSWLEPVTFSVLEEFYTGARGTGPFVLLDPGRRNQLSTNQAGATSASNDTTGFVVAGGEALASSAGPVLRGPRSLRWILPGTVVSGVLDLAPPAGLLGFPTPAGTPWTWSGQLLAPGQAPTVTITPVLSWRNADGSEIATTLGTPVVATGAGWLPFVVSLAAPPAGALYVCPQLRVAPGVLFTTASNPPDPILTRNSRVRPVFAEITGSSLTGGGPMLPLIVSGQPGPPAAPGLVLFAAPSLTTDVYIDQLQLDMASSPRAWALGTGVPQVSITALAESYTTLPQRNVTATLIEVG